MRPGYRGVTLIEVLLAIGVLTIALLSLATVFIAGLKLVSASSELTAATNVGREFLETVKQRGYAATTIGTFDGRKKDPVDGSSGFPPAPYPDASLGGKLYPVVTRCTDFSPTLRTVEVDIYWDSDSKATFSTMVHR